MPPPSNDAETDPNVPSSLPDQGLRSSGMRDLGPQEMQRFRRVERAFLDVCARHEYREIRTPALEPLHLYTATGALSPQLLDGVYSFLDWDGWSGERVVLRPDSTVPAAQPLDEIDAAVRALDDAGCTSVVRTASSGNFEYYSGLTFTVSSGGESLINGGRYDGLVNSLGGREAGACGFAADLLRLAELTQEPSQ